MPIHGKFVSPRSRTAKGRRLERIRFMPTSSTSPVTIKASIIFKSAFPKASQVYKDAFSTYADAQLAAAGIDTPLRLAWFLAQCGHVCVGFTVIRENLTYTSDKRILAIFGVGPGLFISPDRMSLEAVAIMNHGGCRILPHFQRDHVRP